MAELAEVVEDLERVSDCVTSKHVLATVVQDLDQIIDAFPDVNHPRVVADITSCTARVLSLLV